MRRLLKWVALAGLVVSVACGVYLDARAADTPYGMVTYQTFMNANTAAACTLEAYEDQIFTGFYLYCNTYSAAESSRVTLFKYSASTDSFATMVFFHAIDDDSSSVIFNHGFFPVEAGKIIMTHNGPWCIYAVTERRPGLAGSGTMMNQ